MSERLDKLEAELKEMRKEIETSNKKMRKALAKSSDEAKDAFANFYDDAEDAGESLLDDAKYYGRRGVDKARQLVDDAPLDNPWVITGALTGIAIAGIVTTLLIRRDSHDWRRYLPEDSLSDLLKRMR